MGGIGRVRSRQLSSADEYLALPNGGKSQSCGVLAAAIECLTKREPREVLARRVFDPIESLLNRLAGRIAKIR